MKISHSSGLVEEQSLSLPGSDVDPSRPFRLRARSRALRAATRAWAAACDFRTMLLPSLGFSSNQSESFSLRAFWTKDLASALPSLVFVWPSNCGSVSLMETTAVRPSRMSSPETRSSRF